MRLLAALLALLAPASAAAVEVTETYSPLVADLVYTETPPAEADWLVYVTTRPIEAKGTFLVWFFDEDPEEIPCGATRVFRAKTRASAQVKVAFVKARGHARCKRKCDLLRYP